MKTRTWVIYEKMAFLEFAGKPTVIKVLGDFHVWLVYILFCILVHYEIPQAHIPIGNKEKISSLFHPYELLDSSPLFL